MEYIKLSEICDLQNGYAFKSSDYVNYSNTINCRMSNIRPGAIFDLNYSPKYLPDDFAEKYSDYLLNDEDIVIAMTDLAGDPKILGVPAQVKTNGKNVLLNQRVGRLILKNKDIDFRYLKYNLSNPKNKEYYKRFSGGGLQINISKKDILNLEIPLHEKKEQLQIADKLDNIQKIINIRKEEIEKCNKLIKSQFVEMFENKKFPYVQFKEYMERCVDIGSNGANAVVMEHYNMTDTKDFAMVIRFTNLNSGDFENDVKYINKEDYEFYSKSKVYGDEIIFCKIGSAGMNYIMPKLNMPVTLGLNQIMVTPKNINTRYLYEYINSQEGKKYINNNINGAVTKTITKHALWDFPIKTPPIKLQNKFAQIVEQIDKQKFEFEKSLKKLEELQASLMQEYFG